MGKKKDYSKGFLYNCEIKIAKKDMGHDKALFTQREDGSIIASLDGYAIIPVEEYRSLKEQAKISSDRPKLPGGGGAVRNKP